MADSQPMTLTIVTPDEITLETKASFISGRALDGEFGLYPNPAPHIIALDIAPFAYTDESGKKQELAVFGGFLEVEGLQATLVTSNCEIPENIDPERAQRARERAEQRLADRKTDIDIARAEKSLQRALLRLRITKTI